MIDYTHGDNVAENPAEPRITVGTTANKAWNKVTCHRFLYVKIPHKPKCVLVKCKLCFKM
jgi:hypothetical protein